MRKIFIAGVFLLTACSGVPIENQIYAVKSSLVVAEKGATAYVEQPLCGTKAAVGKSVCSKKDIIEKIKKADNAAYTAVNAAQEAQTEDALAIAQTSFKALLEIINNVLEGK